MSSPLKRSISPKTIEETEPESRAGFVSTIFSFFKPSIHSKSLQQHKQQKTSSHQSELNIVQNEPLMNNFISTKKKRLSVQALHKNGFTPRSCTLANNVGVYQAYYDNLKTEKEELNNDLERRLSNFMEVEYGKDTQSLMKRVDNNEREESPIVDMVKQETLSIQNEVVSNESLEDQLPIIIEHEFAPLYKDGEGNLVRPPFINLDPRERYHLLQLKKSIEASESLQRRIKYMVDPNETESNINTKLNKVETATQTHDFNYLENSLNFTSIKRKLETKKNFRKSKRVKNNNGFFVGEFLYDVEDGSAIESSNKLEGYLGNISKPKFNENGCQNDKLVSAKIKSSQDENETFNKFGTENIKSTSSRIGLDNSLLNNNKVKVSLDSDYVEKSEKVSNLFKLKEDNLSKSKNQRATKDSIQPSSGFQFSINKDDIDSIRSKRNEDDELLNKGKVIAEPVLEFGKKQDESPKPSFSFGGISEKKEKSTKPSFSFGKPTEQTTKGSFTVGVEASTGTKDNAPKFTFGTSTAEKQNDKPLFSFGGTSQKKDTSSTTSFAVGISGNGVATKEATKETPNLTFGNVEKKNGDLGFEKKNVPTFSFGGISSGEKKEEIPKVSFGSTAEKKEEAPKPLFAFSKDATVENKDETKTDVPKLSFTFGDSSSSAKKDESIKVSFGDVSANGAKEDIAKPGFTFDVSKSAAPKDESPKPAFTFGNITSTDKKDESATSAFKFGSTKVDEKIDEAQKPVFSFGGASTSAVEKKIEPTKTLSSGDTSSENIEVTKPTFAFGGASVTTTSKDETSKPVFSFGGSTTTPSETSKPSFSFGASPKTDESSKPSFSFGGATTKTTTTPTTSDKKDVKPVLSFGGAADNKAKPAPFIFGGSTPTQKPETSKPAFSFGATTPASEDGTAVKKPTFPFGGTTPSSSTEAPKPAFSFGGQTIAKPAFSFGASSTNNNQPAFPFAPGTNSRSTTPKPAFNFGNTNAGFPMNTNGASNENRSNGAFGAFATGGTASPTNNLASKETTPFGFNTQSSNAFASGNTSTNNSTAKQKVFNFTGTASKEATPDPATIFGGGFNNPATRESTSFAHSNNMNNFGNTPGMNGISMPIPTSTNQSSFGVAPLNPSTTTPPIMSNRKIAQMRQRRR